MNAVENARESAVAAQGMVINGGDSAGAQNGVRVEKVAPPRAANIAILSENTHVVFLKGADFFNK